MEIEKYLLESDDEQEIFDFYSQGPKGNILKRVAYTPTSIPNIWQLVMGDYDFDKDKGSTKSRTRLYQIGINQMYEEIEEDFELFGDLEGEFERFRKNINYNSVIVLKK